MNNIIEKLGIPEIECWIEKIDHDVNHCVENVQKVKELEQQRNDMLVELIDCYEDNEDRSGYDSTLAIIEKATDLSWEEVRELIDE